MNAKILLRTGIVTAQCPSLEHQHTVNNSKNFGLTFDSNLKWKRHNRNTSNKIRKFIYL